MNKITAVVTKEDLFLEVSFSDGQIKLIDIKPYLARFEPFKALVNEKLFNIARVDEGGMGIVWNNEIDLSGYDILHYGISQ